MPWLYTYAACFFPYETPSTGCYCWMKPLPALNRTPGLKAGRPVQVRLQLRRQLRSGSQSQKMPEYDEAAGRGTQIRLNLIIALRVQAGLRCAGKPSEAEAQTERRHARGRDEDREGRRGRNGCKEKGKQRPNRSAWHSRADLANFWPRLRALRFRKKPDGARPADYAGLEASSSCGALLSGDRQRFRKQATQGAAQLPTDRPATTG